VAKRESGIGGGISDQEFDVAGLQCPRMFFGGPIRETRGRKGERYGFRFACGNRDALKCAELLLRATHLGIWIPNIELHNFVAGSHARLGLLAALAGLMVWVATRAFRAYQRSA